MEVDTNRKKYVRFGYTQEHLEKAIDEVVRGKISLNAASVKYNVPKSTLHNKINFKVPLGRQMGPSPELTREEEQKLCDWIIQKSMLGFPMHPDEVFDTIQTFMNEAKRDSKFKDNRPGRKWLALFLKRHPELTKRNAEMISKSRAAVKEGDIREWFKALNKHLEAEGALDILNDPSRIFNADETGVQTCPKTGMILGAKNYKDTYTITCGKEKESITVLCNFSADGTDVPPYIVYPYKRIPRDIAESVPDHWAVGRSDSGWMVSATFYAYIRLFYDWIIEKNIQLPILLFLDGHKSHINKEMSDFCEEKGIMLFALYPNATHILQPCDVSIFRALKCVWKSVVRKHKQTTTKIISKQNFAPLFHQAYTKAIKPSIIKNGFEKCGLFPLNPNNVDYNKCIDTRRQNLFSAQRPSCLDNSGNDDKRATMSVIELEVGEVLTAEFLECYTQRTTHTHAFYPLWVKCKSDTDHSSTPNRPTDVSSNVPSISPEHILLPGNSTDPQKENEISLLSFEVPSHLLQTHEELVNISEFSDLTNLLENTDPVENEQGVSNSTPVDTQKVAFTVQKTKLPELSLPIETTELDTQSEPVETPYTESINNLLISPITEVTVNIEVAPKAHHKNIKVASLSEHHTQKTSEEKVSDSIEDGSSSRQFDSQPAMTEIPQYKSNESTVINTENETPTNSTFIETFLTLPKIETKKKNVIKKEPHPYGLTGKKFKEYFRKKEEDKQKKIQEIAEKKQRVAEKRKNKMLEQHNKKAKGANKSKKTKFENHEDEVFEEPIEDLPSAFENIDPPLSNNNPSLETLPTNQENDLMQYHQRYVVAKFQTGKRLRYFLGKIVLVDNDNKKVKVDFYRKKSRLEDTTVFAKPAIPDVTPVSWEDIVKLLPQPETMRRGVISFNQSDVLMVE